MREGSGWRDREWLEGSQLTRHVRSSWRALGLGLEEVVQMIRKV